MSDEHDRRAREIVDGVDLYDLHPESVSTGLATTLAAALRAERAAAKAEGVREVVAWLRREGAYGNPWNLDDVADEIDRRWGKPVASAPAAGAEVCETCMGRGAISQHGGQYVPCLGQFGCGGTGRRST